jgi:hypothetical protein
MVVHILHLLFLSVRRSCFVMFQNCLLGTAKCLKFHCVIFNLRRNHEATIRIRARYDSCLFLSIVPGQLGGCASWPHCSSYCDIMCILSGICCHISISNIVICLLVFERVMSCKTLHFMFLMQHLPGLAVVKGS